MVYENHTTNNPQFIVHLTTHELEAMLRSVVADALRELRPGADEGQEPDESLLSIDELCNKLQVSRDLVYRLRKKGVLPQYEVGRRKFFKFTEVLAALRSGRRHRGKL